MSSEGPPVRTITVFVTSCGWLGAVTAGLGWAGLDWAGLGWLGWAGVESQLQAAGHVTTATPLCCGLVTAGARAECGNLECG